MQKRVGILTGGGDAPGLNAVLRAFIKRAVGQLDWTVLGVEDSFNGLMETPRRLVDLEPRSCRGLLQRGGTILGTTNRGNPFDFPKRGPTSTGDSAQGDGTGAREDRSGLIAEALREERLQGLVVLGGDGTQAIAHQLMTDHGVPVIGVPKTIDNDLSATDQTFGFQSAVDCATDALDRLHTTAESHERVFFLEVMGRDAGHIALHAGIAGGADIILLPEIPYDPARVAAKVQRRQRLGRLFSLIVVGEGALPIEPDGSAVPRAEIKARLHAGGGASAIARAALEPLVQAEMRTCVLGHLQRGGSPVAYDRLLATRMGVGAADLVEQGRWGEIVCLRNGKIIGAPITEAISKYRFVDVEGELVRTARCVGIELGG